jgi:hypothetical protein
MDQKATVFDNVLLTCSMAPFEELFCEQQVFDDVFSIYSTEKKLVM